MCANQPTAQCIRIATWRYRKQSGDAEQKFTVFQLLVARCQTDVYWILQTDCRLQYSTSVAILLTQIVCRNGRSCTLSIEPRNYYKREFSALPFVLMASDFRMEANRFPIATSSSEFSRLHFSIPIYPPVQCCSIFQFSFNCACIQLCRIYLLNGILREISVLLLIGLNYSYFRVSRVYQNSTDKNGKISRRDFISWQSSVFNFCFLVVDTHHQIRVDGSFHCHLQNNYKGISNSNHRITWIWINFNFAAHDFPS